LKVTVDTITVIIITVYTKLKTGHRTGCPLQCLGHSVTPVNKVLALKSQCLIFQTDFVHDKTSQEQFLNVCARTTQAHCISLIKTKSPRAEFRVFALVRFLNNLHF